jgi:hypothetical protein
MGRKLKMAVLNLRDVPDDLAHALRVEAAQAAIGIKDYCVAIFESRKKIADDSAWVVGENPACAPRGKRELGGKFVYGRPTSEIPPGTDVVFPVPLPESEKQAALAKLRGLVAGIENNVLITPTMGADGNFVEICPVCGGRGLVAGCPECGVIQESFIAGAKPCSLCGEEMVAAKGKWACGDQSCGMYGREQGRVE